MAITPAAPVRLPATPHNPVPAAMPLSDEDAAAPAEPAPPPPAR